MNSKFKKKKTDLKFLGIEDAHVCKVHAEFRGAYLVHMSILDV